MLNLFYLSGNTTGGWVTYTAHLIYGMQQIGIQVRPFKVGNRTEKRVRRFGYGVEYRNLSLREATSLPGVSVVVALQKNYRDKAVALVGSGAWMVVHDPAEFHNLPLVANHKCITIRKAVQQQLPGSKFTPHPYRRAYSTGTIATGQWLACSVSRIDFDKHTEILLDANRLLPDSDRIHIFGFENRLYTKFKICPQYPEWEQSKVAFPRDVKAAADLCHRSTFTVDMSIIKGDGGGTQYTFLEAMDAGSACVIHPEWIIANDEMVPFPQRGANCFTAGTGQELRDLLTDRSVRKAVPSILKSSGRVLNRHRSTMAARIFMEVIQP